MTQPPPRYSYGTPFTCLDLGWRLVLPVPERRVYHCVSRPAVSQQYNQGAVNLSGPQPSYPQHYGPPSMQQVTDQMTGMQITSGPPTAAGPGYGTFPTWILFVVLSRLVYYSYCCSCCLSSTSSQFPSSCQYSLLRCTSALIHYCTAAHFLCPTPTGRPRCCSSAILQRPASSLPAALQRSCPPDFTAAVHLTCGAASSLAANLPTFFSLSRASAQSGSCTRSRAAPAAVPSIPASLLLSTSTCQPGCLRVGPTPSRSRVFPT